MRKYRKDELVRYLASLHLYAQNSSNILRLSMLLYEAMAGKGGKEHIFIPKFQKEIERSYSYDVNEDPQEYLFVDSVHTPRGTYRVFPGIFSYLQYNLTRLFELAEIVQLDERLFKPVYAYLEISDELAERCDYGRYEKGAPEHSTLYCSNYKETEAYLKKAIFRRSEIEALLENLGLEKTQEDAMICHAKQKEFKEFQFVLDGYSPIEKTPLYQLNPEELVVLQPSALLSAAYLQCLDIIRQNISEDELIRRYLDVLMSDVDMAMRQSGAKNCGGAIIDSRLGYLLYYYDNGGIACVTTTHQGTKDDDFKAIEAVIKEQHPDANVFYAETVNALGMDTPSVSSRIDHIILPIDEFKIMMGQEGMSVTDLYYYSQARKGLKNIIGQEIDMFAAYWENKQTFYNYHAPLFTNFVTGNAYELRWRYFSGRDEHLVEGPGHLMMVRHFDEYPDELPIYVPTGDKSKTLFVGEYGKSCLTAIVDAKDDDTKMALREITKCLVVWTYGFGYRYGEELLNRDVKVVINIKNQPQPHMRQIGDDVLEYTIPKRFYELTPKDKTHDQLVVSFWAEALSEFGLTDVVDCKSKVEAMFGECDGSILIIKPQGVEYLTINDGHDASYFVNENACDRVLDDIAHHLNMGGEERKLSLKESRETTLKVIEFLGATLNAQLSKSASDKFVKSLMELHHGTLYWLAITSRRFEKVNAVMNYLGADWREQKALLGKYSETNNLTQCLLERIASNGYYSTEDPIIAEIDQVYAYMHQLYIFGVYLDMLTFKIPGMEMVMLANGRVGLPVDKMNEQMAYFNDLRENELYRPKAYRRLHGILNGPIIDTNDEQFKEAFKDEFKIEYIQWMSVIEKSLEYSIDAEQPIVDMEWEAFEKKVLKKVLGDESIPMFKNVFCLYEGMAEGALPSESFAQRFNRKYQMSSRPWVCFQDRVLYSTKSLHQHEHVMHERLNEGKVHFTSPKMEAYMSDVNRRKGPEFEKILRAFYESLNLDYLKAFRGVNIGPGECLENDEPIGDIDVLLINTACKKIVCMETKDYYESRSMYEVLAENRKTGDDMDKPLKRDAWCKGHIKSFSVLCSDVDETYSCDTIFVTVNMPAYVYSHTEEERPIKVISALDIMDNPMVVFEA